MPDKLLRALLIQIFYSIHSEWLLCEQPDYDLLFLWFFQPVDGHCGLSPFETFQEPGAANEIEYCVKTLWCGSGAGQVADH